MEVSTYISDSDLVRLRRSLPEWPMGTSFMIHVAWVAHTQQLAVLVDTLEGNPPETYFLMIPGRIWKRCEEAAALLLEAK